LSVTAVRELAYDVSDSWYSYDAVPALQGTSLRINSGERLALIGPNGSGKSTLLRLLAGLSFPHRGRVSFRGDDLSESRFREDDFFFSFRRRVGMVFQNPDIQLFNASVFDEVAFGPLQLQWTKAKVREHVEDTLCKLGIADLRNRSPHRLSGGEKKRVAIASVLVLDPEVLLLDEPTATLDPSSQSQIAALLSEWKNSSKTLVTATHDLDLLEEIADRCCILESGRVVAEGDPLAILHDVDLLKRTRLIRAHRHVHEGEAERPHSHLHTHDVP
jgi:cobalt/nickel transport system ATP-binding protein